NLVKQGPDKRDGGSTLPVSHPRIRQSFASRGALFLWAIILSFLVMIVIAACQRSEEDGTAVVQLPVVPERPTGSSNENPGSATGYPEPIPGYPPGATPSPGSTSAYPGPPTPTPTFIHTNQYGCCSIYLAIFVVSTLRMVARGANTNSHPIPQTHINTRAYADAHH
ncbi:MAG: hypothetical protein AMJ56_13640, partial [Anaerolineae bacterium SG8_19]